MKVLLLAPALFTGDGGIPRILALYSRALADLAPHVKGVRFVALNDLIADDRDLRRYTGANLEAWSCCSGSKRRFIRESFRLSAGCDHIICGHIGQLPVALALSLLRPGLTYDLVAHGIEVWRRPSLFQRLALRRVRRVLCVSEFTRFRMEEVARVPSSRMTIVHNGLDVFFEIPTKAPTATEPPTALCVSRLSQSDAYKGVDTLIEAMPAVLVRRPDFRLRIIGQGDDRARLAALISKLGLGHAVTLSGYVSDKELQQALRDCRMLTLPSRSEGFGLVYLEAMAQGKPCLGARAGGAPEVITPETGLLVEYGDRPAIAEAMLEMLEQKWSPATILSRAREFSYPRFRERLARALSLPTG
jgi:glycosyltransferase involved in cell wall biosynthesis